MNANHLHNSPGRALRRIVRRTVLAVALSAVPAAFGQTSPTDSAVLAQSRDRESYRDRSDRSDRSDRRSSSYSRSDRSDRSDSGSRSDGPSTRPASFNDSYGLLLQRNIFSRSRVVPTLGGSASGRPAEVPLTPQQQWVLTGITQEEGTGTYTAFLENVRTNQTTRHRTGESLAGGKITAITLNSIEYHPENGSAPLRVDIGTNLEGRAPAIPSTPSYTSSSSSFPGSPAGSTSATPAAPGAAPAAPGASNDILERLRQRRMQETKQP